MDLSRDSRQKSQRPAKFCAGLCRKIAEQVETCSRELGNNTLVRAPGNKGAGCLLQQHRRPTHSLATRTFGTTRRSALRVSLCHRRLAAVGRNSSHSGRVCEVGCPSEHCASATDPTIWKQYGEKNRSHRPSRLLMQVHCWLSGDNESPCGSLSEMADLPHFSLVTKRKRTVFSRRHAKSTGRSAKKQNRSFSVNFQDFQRIQALSCGMCKDAGDPSKPADHCALAISSL